jgi:hypothetical protein
VRSATRVSNHAAPVAGLILREAAKVPLLRMRVLLHD